MRDRAIAVVARIIVVAIFAGCDRPPVVRGCDFDAAFACPNMNNPVGRIEGTIIYEGPPPAESLNSPGVVSGRVVLLLFEADNPPPPDGTATRAVTFQTISAAHLFDHAVRISNDHVRATIPFAFPGIDHGGVYQLRAFYSRDEQRVRAGSSGVPFTTESGFHPLYSVRNQPTRGDVAGGALIASTARPPQFVQIVVGEGGRDGGRGTCVIPPHGFVVKNVTVFLGQVLPLERPMFRIVTAPETVATPSGPRRLDPPVGMTVESIAPPPFSGPVPVPSEELVTYARETGLISSGTPVLTMRRNPAIRHLDTGADIPAFTASVSLASDPDECTIAAFAGVRCAGDPVREIGFVEVAFDQDKNGRIDLTSASRWVDAHPTFMIANPLASGTNGRVPWLYPLVIFTKLHDPTAAEAQLLREGQRGWLTPEAYGRLRAALSRPESLDESDPNDRRYPTLLFGSVLPDGMAANLLSQPWTQGFQRVEPFVRIAVMPIAIEVHGPNRATDWHLVLPPLPAALVPALQPFLPLNYRCVRYDRSIDPNDPVHQSGVPAGRYAVNLIGPTGQSWTVPNELAEFSTAIADPSLCPDRVCRAPSQGVIVRIQGLEPPSMNAPVDCPTPPRRMPPRRMPPMP